MPCGWAGTFRPTVRSSSSGGGGGIGTATTPRTRSRTALVPPLTVELRLGLDFDLVLFYRYRMPPPAHAVACALTRCRVLAGRCLQSNAMPNPRFQAKVHRQSHSPGRPQQPPKTLPPPRGIWPSALNRGLVLVHQPAPDRPRARQVSPAGAGSGCPLEVLDRSFWAIWLASRRQSWPEIRKLVVCPASPIAEWGWHFVALCGARGSLRAGILGLFIARLRREGGEQMVRRFVSSSVDQLGKSPLSAVVLSAVAAADYAAATGEPGGWRT